MLTGSPYVDRGWVSVIVDHTIAADLAPKIEQFKRDLVADGWTVAPDSTDSQILGHAQAPRMDDEKYVWNNNDAQDALPAPHPPPAERAVAVVHEHGLVRSLTCFHRSAL
jgi:hypothetical protein